MASLDPRWAGGRPRRITTDDEDFIVEAATTRPEALGLPFTRWSLRKLAAYLGDNQTRVVKISAERLRQILAARGVTFQRTKTWKESNDPERDAKLDRIEEVLGAFPQRCFAFDEFGPLTIRPVAGAGWALAGRPPLIAANYHKAHGVRQFHGATRQCASGECDSGECAWADVNCGPGRIRTSVGEADGFTARSLWPLGHRPKPASTIPSPPTKPAPRPPGPLD